MRPMASPSVALGVSSTSRHLRIAGFRRVKLSCGISDHRIAPGDIASDSATRPNDGARADAHPGQQHGSRAHIGAGRNAHQAAQDRARADHYILTDHAVMIHAGTSIDDDIVSQTYAALHHRACQHLYADPELVAWRDDGRRVYYAYELKAPPCAGLDQRGAPRIARHNTDADAHSSL